MRKIFFAMTFVISASLLAWGDAIPYPDVGTIAPTVTITAASTGNVEGYFYGFSAADSDSVQMCDLTQSFCSGFELNNQTTTIGDSFDFGSVVSGDLLIFNLQNLSTGNFFSSDPTFSVDGINHAYVTPYTGDTAPPVDAGIPTGTFIGMEDSRYPGSDLDYNDTEFVFTNLLTAATPEPSFLLLCAGVLAALPIVRRKLRA